MEERLIPYQDTLPVGGTSFTSYNKQVCGWLSEGPWALSEQAGSVVDLFGRDEIQCRPFAFLQVLGLRGVVTAPARLESTCLLFSYGVDLQYTRLAPAKGFDSLDDDFSYGLLMVALAALTGGAVFMHLFTKNAVLKNKWQ